MKVTIFNVGHGVSVLIEFPPTSKSRKPIGIVDCFWGKRDENQLFNKLEELEQEYSKELDIKFFIITHFHGDHFIGVGDILRKFGSKIQKFCDPGLSPKEIFVAEFPLRDSEVHSQARRDIREIQNFKDRYPNKVFPLVTPDVSIYEDEENKLFVKTVAPNGGMLEDVKKKLTNIYQKAKKAKDSGDSVETAIKKASQSYDLNKTSSAIQISYKGKSIIFGGDVLKSSWNAIIDTGIIINPNVFLLSHHGALNAFPENYWEMIRKGDINTIISANGKSHPDPKVLSFLLSNNESVWLTNLPEKSKDELYDWTLAFHYNVKKSSWIKQGNIECSIDDNIEIVGPCLNKRAYFD